MRSGFRRRCIPVPPATLDVVLGRARGARLVPEAGSGGVPRQQVGERQPLDVGDARPLVERAVVEAPAAVRAIAEPDFPTLALDKLLYDGKAHAATFNLIARFQGLEHAEHPVSELLRNAGTIVGHGELGDISGALCVDLDATGRGVVVMLDAVIDQILQDLDEGWSGCP